MKANIFLNIFLLSSMALMAACSEEERYGEEVTTTLRACIEQPATTKTSLSEPSSGLYKTLWTENDKIAVYAGASSTGAEFSLISGAGTNNGEFNGTIPSGSRLAVYPYSICGESSGSSIKVTLPEEQMYKPGNIPDNAYPMVAAPSESTLLFKNLCSVLKISMTGSLTVNSVTFTANNSDIKVSGDASIDAGKTALTMADDAGSRLVLKCDGVKLSGTATDFFIVVPSQTYTGGFALTIDTDKGKVLKTIKSDVTLKRSELYRISTFECGIDDDQKNIVIEDANFKAYLVANFDTDGDGEISKEEALAITEIIVGTKDIESLAGIEHMANLTELRCEGPWSSFEPEEDPEGKLKTLDVSKNVNLTILYCGFNQLTSLDVTNNPKIEQLRCAGNNLNSLDVSKNTELIEFEAYNNRLSSIDVSNNPKLYYIDLTNNQIKSIDVSNNLKLGRITCSNNKLTSIDVTNNQKLTTLNISGNSIVKIDLGNNPDLEYLNCNKNKISELELSNNKKLESLNVNDNNLTSLTVNCCPEIETLKANNNLIKEMDISELTSLFDFYCSGNPLETLYVFDGQIDALFEKEIPSTTKIVVKGSEEPEDWTDKEFWHKSLGIRFTATWCGYCPNLATGFAKAVSQYPNKIELLNLHPTTSQLGFSGTSAMDNIFNISGYPTGFVDYRTIIENHSSDYAAKLIVNAVKETESNYPTKTGISFTSSVSGSKLSLNVKLYIKEKGDYKVTAVLLEDDIIGYQNGGGNSYNHSSIARVALSDITGDAVSTSEDNKTVSKSYTATIPSSCDKNNLRILVYVLKQYGSQTVIRTADYGEYYVDNAVSAPTGRTQSLVFSDGTVYGGNEGIKDGGEITLK